MHRNVPLWATLKPAHTECARMALGGRTFQQRDECQFVTGVDTPKVSENVENDHSSLLGCDWVIFVLCDNANFRGYVCRGTALAEWLWIIPCLSSQTSNAPNSSLKWALFADKMWSMRRQKKKKKTTTTKKTILSSLWKKTILSSLWKKNATLNLDSGYPEKD